MQLYRRLIALRRRHEALRIGSYRQIKVADEALLFIREHAGERLLIALNMGRELQQESKQASKSVAFANGFLRGEVLLSSFCDRNGETIAGDIKLRPAEGIIVKLATDAVVPV